LEPELTYSLTMAQQQELEAAFNEY
jgi:hypothetical protein